MTKEIKLTENEKRCSLIDEVLVFSFVPKIVRSGNERVLVWKFSSFKELGPEVLHINLVTFSMLHVVGR